MAFTLPLLAVVWVSVFNAYDRYKTVREISQLQQFTRIAVKAGTLVGQLQSERGLSLIYLESRHSMFRERLQSARASTDHHLAQLNAHLHDAGYPITHSVIYQNIDLTALALGGNRLRNIRRRVDTHDTTEADIDFNYTQPILDINRQINQLSALTRQNELGRELNAYFILNRYRELLGRERILLSFAILNQALDEAQLKQLMFMAGQENSLITGFLSQVDNPNRFGSIGYKTRSGRFRQALIETPDREQLLETNSTEDWFEWQSERIRQVTDIEKRLVDNILEKTETLAAAANNELWRYLVISPATLLVSIFLALLIFKQIRFRLLLARNVFDHTHDRITVTDANSRIVDVNAAFTRITGYDRQEVLGQRPSMLKSGKQEAAFYEKLWQDLQTSGFWQGEIWNRRKNGEFYAELTTISAVRDRKGVTRNYVAVSSDITDRASEHQRQLQHSAYHDPLTGLPNQMLAMDRLDHALNASRRVMRPLIVASIDLDHFSAINDRHGHAFGDQLLELVAQRLKTILRDGDTLARIGGDEFLVIIEDFDTKDSARKLLKRIQQELSSPFMIKEHNVSVSASIGATSTPGDAGDADTLIRHSTQALHQAKLNGRSRLSWFDPQQGKHQRALSELIERLGKAITDNELRLHYQPKVHMVTGRVFGFEALLRWEHPEKGLLPPGEFLPPIEQHPFSIMIGNWVIEQAITQILDWQAKGLQLSVSVNINALQLLDKDFIQTLEKHIRRHPELDPSNLELEILESAAINDIDRAGKILADCHSLGIKVSLDDFGTGYAALEYLKRLPAETLKIDQTFIRDMHADTGDQAIVRGIIGLADAFGFGVIAEGVETEAQGVMLISMGCHNAQGYGIAKPMPASAAEAWLHQWQPPLSWLDTGKEKG